MRYSTLKWRDHLEDLRKWSVLEVCGASQILDCATYFAVIKEEIIIEEEKYKV